MVWALILTLSASGQFEIRTAGSFENAPQCLEAMHELYPTLDHRQGSIFIRCIPATDAENVLKALIGGRA